MKLTCKVPLAHLMEEDLLEEACHQLRKDAVSTQTMFNPFRKMLTGFRLTKTVDVVTIASVVSYK